MEEKVDMKYRIDLIKDLLSLTEEELQEVNRRVYRELGLRLFERDEPSRPGER